ncbi:hypothetical protein [Nonomuraea sp. NPDC050202]|uniref:hypothetical protein n=1 Tax=Nonomuraea sp. NPDC050202 TaxID=3155035 RepID=UPI0033F12D63
MAVIANGQRRALSGQGEPQVIRMLLLQILTGRRASEILRCTFDCLSPATGRAVQAAGGERVAPSLRPEQDREGARHHPVDADVVVVIHEQQQWVREQFGEPTEYLLPKHKANETDAKAFPEVPTARRLRPSAIWPRSPTAPGGACI